MRPDLFFHYRINVEEGLYVPPCHALSSMRLSVETLRRLGSSCLSGEKLAIAATLAPPTPPEAGCGHIQLGKCVNAAGGQCTFLVQPSKRDGPYRIEKRPVRQQQIEGGTLQLALKLRLT